jgi:hypothetical protein
MVQANKNKVGLSITLHYNFYTKNIMSLFYYDENNYKIGPIEKEDLIRLAREGKINAETRIADNKGKETKAKNIPNLKFYTPEYHRAEKLFDLENIDLNSTVPTTSDNQKNNQVTKQDIPPIINKQSNKKTISNLFTSQKKENTEQTENNTYRYLSNVANLGYLVASFVWYGGLTITCLTSLILFFFPNGIHLLSIPVFFIGFVASFAISNNIGFRADLAQWRINTEKNLNEIKNRLNQND